MNGLLATLGWTCLSIPTSAPTPARFAAYPRCEGMMSDGSDEQVGYLLTWLGFGAAVRWCTRMGRSSRLIIRDCEGSHGSTC